MDPINNDISSPSLGGENLKFATFNCNGLAPKMRRIALFLKFKKDVYDFVCLQETHVLRDNILNEIIGQWEGPVHFSRGTGRGKGLITLFHEKFDQEMVTEIFKTDRLLVSSIKIGSETLTVINVYAPCETNDKANFFNCLLDTLHDNIPALYDSHYVVMGDFNIAKENIDILNGAQHSQRIRLSLTKFIDNAGLTDAYRLLHPETKVFTWSKGGKKASKNSARRLDYILVSDSLVPYIKSCAVKNYGFSDHKAVSLTLQLSTFKFGKGLFKLNTSLLQDENYKNIIIKEIKNTQLEYQALNPHLLWDMIKVNVREASQQYSRFKSRENKLAEERHIQKLSKLEQAYSQSPNDDSLLNKINKIQTKMEITDLNRARGAQVRSRVKFVEDDEKNTAFFRNLEKTQSNTNTIKRLTLSTGVQTCNERQILEEIQTIFKQRYNKKTNNKINVPEMVEKYIKNLKLPRLGEVDKAFCDRPLSDEEVTEAADCMNTDSSPGADGLPSEFYQVFWQYIKVPLIKCFNYSFEVKSLTHSQKLGVISLLHKGKELQRDDLNNWRPLTLLCVDEKILAKALSRRVDKVIDKLIGEQQTGFMKGRDISTLHRRIDDLIELQKKLKKKGLIVALDFRQAFDTINMQFVYKSLEVFGFGENFIKWIKILNADRQSCIKNGGHISEPFPMTNGVRQGCVVSPQLFLLAVELLAQKIKQDADIIGLNPYNAINPTKVLQLADDTTLCLKNEQDLKRALTLLNNFSIFSDLHLNLKKCFGISITGEPFDLRDTDIELKECIKVLGIYYSPFTPASLNPLNWESKVKKIRKILGLWYKRKLNLISRIQVIKTYCLSQLVYIIRSISIPEAVLQDINRIFFEYIWKGKPDAKKSIDKVKRSVLCNDIRQGGLNMIDIISFQNSILINWAKWLILAADEQEWKLLARTVLKGVGGISVFHSKVQQVKNFKGLNQIYNPFWVAVVKAWLKHADTISSASELGDPLFNNDNIKYKGSMLYYPECLYRGIIKVQDMVDGNQIIPYEEFTRRVNRHPNSLIMYFGIVSGLKRSIYKNLISRELVHNTNTNPESNPNSSPNTNPCITTFQGYPIESLSRKLLYSLIKPRDTPNCLTFWFRKFGLEIDSLHWDLIKKIRGSKLRVLSWKIVHNIFPTGTTLFKMKIRNDNRCIHCAGELVDSLEHFFVECSQIRGIWQEIRALVLKNLGFVLNLTPEAILTGVVEAGNIKSHHKLLINQALAIGRYTVSKFKYYKKGNIIDVLHDELALRNVLIESHVYTST